MINNIIAKIYPCKGRYIMKKQILLVNIFLFFTILFPVFIMANEIENISPPAWILGSWVTEEDTDNPFIAKFTSNDIIMDDESFTVDIKSGYIIAFKQSLTEEYYEIYVQYDNYEWFQEKFIKRTNIMMESQFASSDGIDFFSVYTKY